MQSGPALIRIKASAGSGKTYQLALHYVRTLHILGRPDPKKLRRVIAITFTNKAAAEMKERVVTFLKEIALETEKGAQISEDTDLTNEEARKWLEIILRHYGDFHVRTIDSFLFNILKGFSFELGIDPDSSVKFSFDDILETAFDFLLSQAASSNENRQLWKELLCTYLELEKKGGGFYPERGIKSTLGNLFVRFAEQIDKLEAVRFNIQNIYLAESQLRKAYKDVCIIVSELDAQGYANRTCTRHITSDLDIEKILKSKTLRSTPPDQFVKKACLKKDGMNNLLKNLAEQLKNLRESILRYEESISIIPYARVSGYLKMLRNLRREVDEICRQEHIILSRHWTEQVQNKISLGDTLPLIYCYLGEAIQHIMFDEFQDTSRTQWEALEPLVENVLSMGGTLFVVGDVKQAIYRWRGGDLSLFDEILHRFPSVINPECVQLSTNFRSHPELIDFFNNLFAPLSDEDWVRYDLAPMAIKKEIYDNVRDAFASKVVKIYENHYQVASPKVSSSSSCLCRIYDVQTEDIDEAVKDNLIQEIRREWPRREVAVLVRRHDDAEKVSGWLFEHSIPVVTERSLRLGTSIIIKGLICLLKYLYSRGRDMCAFYGILSSGILCGISYDEQQLSHLWMEDMENLKREVDTICEDLSVLANRMAPYELLVSALRRTGILYRIEQDSELLYHRPFIQRLLEITHEFQVTHLPSLGEYLAFWEEGGLEEIVGLPEHVKAVKVMTVHKAKGLEFPVVFIPFTNWSVVNRAPVTICDRKLILLAGNLSEDLERLRQQIIAEEAVELINLFYVAVTRAREALYCYLTPSGKRGSKGVAEWVKAMLEKARLTDFLYELK